MEAVLLIVLLLFVAAVAFGAYATVKAVGAAKRGVDRTIAQARRSVEDTALRAKSLGQPGAQGELAQLRLRLRTSMRATQEALYGGVAVDASLEESVRLFERLSAHGRDLEEHLRQAERDPDRARVGSRMAELRERTEQITHAADSLRWAVRDRAHRFASDDLSALSADIDVESGALRHWAPVEGDGGAPGDATAAGGAAAAQGPGPEALDAADPDRFGGGSARRRRGAPWGERVKRAEQPGPEATN
ncbi:hypothetical protein AB0910_05455 [Streptomyces sp. NPDC047002]|uniref:hypothetical protein n=1 Tax=Streptomyces sp. NPDC047002 TaxID=3155475 RepID=UPI003457174D